MGLIAAVFTEPIPKRWTNGLAKALRPPLRNCFTRTTSGSLRQAGHRYAVSDSQFWKRIRAIFGNKLSTTQKNPGFARVYTAIFPALVDARLLVAERLGIEAIIDD